MSLVVWIAIFIKFIAHLKVYMDDVFSFNDESDFTYYPPYQTSYPSKQTKLLLLWDELGIPHDKSKQVWGRKLEIIGFLVDPNNLSIEFPPEKRALLIDHIEEFAVHRLRWTLREYLRVAGWCNWAFNVFPLLRPGLSALYQKTRGKKKMFAAIQINKRMVIELHWIKRHLQTCPGILLLDSLHWNPFTDECSKVYVDASTSKGLGFWFPDINVGYQSPVPAVLPCSNIDFLEALAVCSAVRASIHLPHSPHRLAIYSDSTFAVDIFSSLRADSPYNQILMTSIDDVLLHHIDFRVLHVAGMDNTIADALSRFDNLRAEVFSPGIQINPFTPPSKAIGLSS
ncbi:hypothetical protein BJ138DRAFT_1132731 [Hygrophoropsis aurantiaca]|uniref:Uncharacterized protein n=1 Tax=Hygrophoropsis aurantiaca TaxID=72124 RepID=A0ACB8ANX5_9AGAM|nr:hypothetical protein BJ138DRAFT_1132731 [Hygrophoropsis aurantiaca]